MRRLVVLVFLIIALCSCDTYSCVSSHKQLQSTTFVQCYVWYKSSYTLWVPHTNYYYADVCDEWRKDK